jgi:hypothetical protein
MLVGLYLGVRSWLAGLQIPQEGPYAWDLSASVGLRNASSYLADALYVRDWIDPSSQWGRWSCIGILGVTIAAARWLRGARPVLLLGSGWFAVTVLPLLPMANRAYSFYAYLPLVGAVIAAATLIGSFLRFLQQWLKRSLGARLLLVHAAEAIGIVALVLGWVRFSTAQIRATESKDPLGILSKSILAQKAILEVRALYPELPVHSTLYVVDITERDAWAFGHGDLFRLYYPNVRVVLAAGQDQIKGLDAQHAYLYRFRDHTQ